MNKELNTFLNEVINKDEGSDKTFKTYLRKKINEHIIVEGKKLIWLDANDVYVKGKKAGTISYETKQKVKKINFTDNDGKIKQFDSLGDMYTHVAKSHNIVNEDNKFNVSSIAEGKELIWHDNDNVYVKGKKAGTIQFETKQDLQKIKFTSNDGKIKWFDSVGDMYKHVAKSHNVE